MVPDDLAHVLSSSSSSALSSSSLLLSFLVEQVVVVVVWSLWSVSWCGKCVSASINQHPHDRVHPSVHGTPTLACGRAAVG